MADPADDFAARSGRFVEWFKSIEGTSLSDKISLVDLRSEGAGRGVIAREDIPVNEVLFRVPRSMVLEAPDIVVHPTGEKRCQVLTISAHRNHGNDAGLTSVLICLEGQGSWLPLIVTIIHEYLKGEESYWYPYFQVLPTTFNTLMFWNEHEVAELQASAVVKKIGKSEVEKEWKQKIIMPMLAQPLAFPLEEVEEEAKIARLTELAHMAASLISAYSFDLDRDEDDGNKDDGDEDDLREDDEVDPLKGMVPFADMLNADADLNNARLSQEDDNLVMYTIRPVKAGEQLYNDYGELPRSELLRCYGYITPNYAQYDVAELAHDLLVELAGLEDPKNNEAWRRAVARLDDKEVLDDGYSIYLRSPVGGPDAYVPEDLRTVLRALTTFTASGFSKFKVGQAMTKEEATLLSAAASRRLSEYATTLEEDRRISAQSPVALPNEHVQASRYTAAVVVRQSEKEILQLLIDRCAAHLTQLQAESQATARESQKKRKLGDDQHRSRKAVKANGHR
ncbi:Ribosomal lysine N-methyltransferase 4 [Cyphellophora attinorum]|uniref:Ribosomal lysine N-methyltransferase 4 n=1 Tax=Cyphellophora attinorum TaxID=1664694 RepID=A0A0N1H0K6_9EURO|nr:Ribosomal lysine N-methyltransferase 4 [Phialophora attinorum]KPI37297.1 Ribosomal lysine N-methyltransferase 4 [Phialophora attinorum]